jgi:hypothetical protein
MMAQISKKLRSWASDTHKGLTFYCPACKQAHGIRTEGTDIWGWNGDVERPTFTPSVLVSAMYGDPPVTPENLAEWKRAPWPQTKVARICHSFVTDGMIQFLGDCTHALAGQTVPLADFPEHYA